MTILDEEAISAEFTPELEFSEAVIGWQKKYGRHSLPWQNTDDAYRIWLSEVMLQQTQVAAVIPYYLRFLERFSDVFTLASATQEEVMSHWSGLGYYSRARNLHRCAQYVVEHYAGIFPKDPLLLAELPGIGKSTAAAIAAFAYGVRAAILDGNVKRVFARVFGVKDDVGASFVEERLWARANALLPARDIGAYTQGLMDLGATICTRTKARCQQCPLMSRCVAYATDQVHALPVRKPKKITPQKQVVMFVIVDGDYILLQQRPNEGIWGGLLSLPEVGGYSVVADGDDIVHPEISFAKMQKYLAAFGRVVSYNRLPALLHVFTHFKLHILPYHIVMERGAAACLPVDCAWYAKDQLAKAHLPAPIKKILLSLIVEPDLFSPFSVEPKQTDTTFGQLSLLV